VPKSVWPTFIARSKDFKAKFTIIKTFHLVPKSERPTFIPRLKVLKAYFTIIKTWDLVPKNNKKLLKFSI